MHRHLLPLAALLPAVFAVPAAAQPDPRLGQVVVTATRFDEPALTSAADVTVISREEIRSSGASSLPDVLRARNGLHVMPLYGSIGADTAIDMRGFGEGASSRTLVLLNGQRLNPLDSASVDWGLVPLDGIERIEIINGSGSVLYGDNAVGGVVNIVTGKAPDGAHVQIGAGSQDSRQVSAGFSRSDGGVDLSLSANRQQTDGWRRNNRQERDNVAGRLSTRFDRGSAFVDLGGSDLSLGLPGALTRAQYEQDPRQPETPDSYARRRNAFLRPGFELRLADSVKLAAELGHSSSDNTAYLSNWCYPGGTCFDRRKTNVLSFTPRLQWQHGFGALPARTTIGFDHYGGDLTADKSETDRGPVVKTVRVDQSSQGFYLHNLTGLTPDLTLTVGARHQRVEQAASDSTGAGLVNGHSRTVGEVGLSHRLSNALRAFARTGTTFRYANLDELTTFTGFATKPVRPERGRFVEAGFDLTGRGYALKAMLYDLDMKDEIAFNGLTWENENLAKTRHRGVTVSGRRDLGAGWSFVAGVDLQRARFSDGVDAGRRIPLVPEVKATAGLGYRPTALFEVSVMAVHVGARPMGGDTANTAYDRLGAYTTADLVAAWRWPGWTLRARVSNLTDRKYAPVGYYGSYYPADGRALFADLRHAF